MTHLIGLFLAIFSISACGPDSDSTQFRGPDSAESVNPVFSQPGQPAQVELKSPQGLKIEAHLWRTRASLASPHRAGIIFITGIDGHFIEPVDGIYSRLADSLAQKGVVSIFVRYRYPGELTESVEDAVAGGSYLRTLGVQRMAIVGWSFGGAVMTNATLRIPEIVTAVGIAPQSQHTEAVSNFTRQSILLIHSREDENVGFYASEQILATAPAGLRTHLEAFPEGNHYLSGMSGSVDPVVHQWLVSELGL